MRLINLAAADALALEIFPFVVEGVNWRRIDDVVAVLGPKAFVDRIGGVAFHETARWAYWREARFRTEADAVFIKLRLSA